MFGQMYLLNTWRWINRQVCYAARSLTWSDSVCPPQQPDDIPTLCNVWSALCTLQCRLTCFLDKVAATATTAASSEAEKMKKKLLLKSAITDLNTKKRRVDGCKDTSSAQFTWSMAGAVARSRSNGFYACSSTSTSTAALLHDQQVKFCQSPAPYPW